MSERNISNKIMSKKNKSVNRLRCQLSGDERMSNRKYIQAKADKKGVSVEEFKASYVKKAEYVRVKAEVESVGLDQAAERLSITRDSLKKILALNGKGTYSQPESV